MIAGAKIAAGSLVYPVKAKFKRIGIAYYKGYRIYGRAMSGISEMSRKQDFLETWQRQQETMKDTRISTQKGFPAPASGF